MLPYPSGGKCNKKPHPCKEKSAWQAAKGATAGCKSKDVMMGAPGIEQLRL